MTSDVPPSGTVFVIEQSNMRVLLISLQEDIDIIGLKYLHYFLLRNGHESYLLYMPQFKHDDMDHLEGIRKFVTELNPGLIGISLMSVEYTHACHVTQDIKSFNKTTPIVWGGIHPTISPAHCLDYADYVCIGEGEKTLLDMADAISRGEPLKDINNLCYLEGGTLKKNVLNPLEQNLDSIPHYEHVPVNGFILNGKNIEKINKRNFRKHARFAGKTYSIISTRGCPFSCTYCCNNFLIKLYHSQRIRKRSAQNIIRELEHLLENHPEIEYINFQDDCFLACSETYLKEFCALYKEKIAKPFIIRAIPTYITHDKIEMLQDAGLAWVTSGLQSGSDRTCKEIYKRRSLKADFLRAAHILHELKVAAYYDIITDNPFENDDDRLETIDTFIRTPKPFFAQFFSLVFFKGTELYEMAQEAFPQYTDTYLHKDFLVLHKNLMNKLIRLSAFVDGKLMQRLIDQYKENPDGVRFKTLLFSINLMNMFFYEPIAYFRVIKLSQRGSYLKTLKLLSMYFKIGIRRYLLQFQGLSETTEAPATAC